MPKKIISQNLNFDTKGCWLITKWSDGSISSEPITSEEAAEFEARHNY